MRWHLHPDVKTNAGRSLDWLRAFLAPYDVSALGWVRIDFGREHQDRLGRRYRRFRGVYGRCWYPSSSQPSIRISCQVPGPFPCDIPTRKTPVYREADGSWPAEARRLRGPIIVDRKSGRQWKRVYGSTRVQSLDEGIVWIFAHEAFHWLRRTRQIPGRNNEVEADAFADRMLEAFRVQEGIRLEPPVVAEPRRIARPPPADRQSVRSWVQKTLALLQGEQGAVSPAVGTIAKSP